MLLTILSSIGFMFAVMTFTGGFRMIRRLEHREEAAMHRFNGYITIIIYPILAIAAIVSHGEFIYILPWLFGFMLHLLKLLLVKKGLAVRYGGYMGSTIITTWLIIIFMHLPK